MLLTYLLPFSTELVLHAYTPFNRAAHAVQGQMRLLTPQLAAGLTTAVLHGRPAALLGLFAGPPASTHCQGAVAMPLTGEAAQAMLSRCVCSRAVAQCTTRDRAHHPSPCTACQQRSRCPLLTHLLPLSAEVMLSVQQLRFQALHLTLPPVCNGGSHCSLLLGVSCLHSMATHTFGVAYLAVASSLHSGCLLPPLSTCLAHCRHASST